MKKKTTRQPRTSSAASAKAVRTRMGKTKAAKPTAAKVKTAKKVAAPPPRAGAKPAAKR